MGEMAGAGTPGSRGATGGVREVLEKVAASLAVVASTGGLVVFAHLGAFHDGNDPFPHAEIARTD